MHKGKLIFGLIVVGLSLCNQNAQAAGYPKLANYYLHFFSTDDEVTSLQNWDAYVLPLENLGNDHWTDDLYAKSVFFYQDVAQVVVWNGHMNAGPEGSCDIGDYQTDLFWTVDGGDQDWWLLGVGSPLTEAVSAEATVLSVEDARQFQYIDWENNVITFAGLMIGDEHMFIKSVDLDTDEITVVRGHEDSLFTPAAHSAGETARPHIEFWVYRNEAENFLMIDWMVDLTDACPFKTVDGSSHRWNTYLPHWMEDQLAAEPSDTGIFWDDVWGEISGLNRHPDTLVSHIDVDRDGQPEDADDLDLAWVAGIKTLLAESGSVHPQRPLQANMQRFFSSYYPWLDGMLSESYQSFWEGDASPWAQLTTLSYAAHCLPDYTTVNISTPLDDDAAFRYHLGLALLAGAYFSFDSGSEDHGQLIWRDEYGGGDNVSTTLLDQGYLGDPTGDARPAGYHGPNVVICEDFTCEDGWIREATPPESAAFSIVAGPTSGSNAQRISVSDATDPADDVNLHQGSLALTAEKNYALSFFAKADSARSISAAVCENGAEEDVLLERSVPIETDWQLYILPFETIDCPTVSLDDMKVLFALGAATGAVDISRVQIRNEDGAAPLTWESSLKKQEKAAPDAAGCILNGDFDATDPWEHWTQTFPDESAMFSIVSGPNGSDNAVQVDVRSTTIPNHEIQLYQDEIVLEPEKIYLLAFYARSSPRRPFYVGANLFRGPLWTDYGGESFFLTSFWQRQSFIISTIGAEASALDNIKIGFVYGDAEEIVEIAHVSLTEYSNDPWLPNLVNDWTYDEQWLYWTIYEGVTGMADWSVTTGIEAGENATRIDISQEQSGSYVALQQDELAIEANRDYLVMLWAKSSGHHSLQCNLRNNGLNTWTAYDACGSTVSKCGAAGAIIDTEWQPIVFTGGTHGLTEADLTNPKIEILVNGEAGWVDITRTAVIEAGPLVYLRSFANGQALVNLTEWPAFVWLEAALWKINGVEDSAHNSGESVQYLTVDSMDSYILINYDPAAIDLLDFSAARVAGGIVLYWRTGTELTCGAFTILRCETDPFQEVPCDLQDHLEIEGRIPCENNPNGAEYWTLDAQAQADATYSYYLREYETTGGIREYGPLLVPVDRRHGRFHAVDSRTISDDSDIDEDETEKGNDSSRDDDSAAPAGIAGDDQA